MAVSAKTVGGAGALGAGGVGGGYAMSKALSDNELKSTQKINEKLGSEWIFKTVGEDNKDQFKSSLQKLKGISNKDSLSAELQTISKSTDNEEQVWKQLQEWCKSTYDKEYQASLFKEFTTYCKKPSIKEALNDTQLPDQLDAEWTKKVTSAVDTKNTSSPFLKEKLSAIDNDSDNSKKRTVLKQWCKDQYQKPFDTKTTTNSTEKDLLAETKKWCVVLIEDNIEASKKFTDWTGNTDQAKWKEHAKTLREYPKAGSNTANDPSLEETITKVKNQITDNQGAGWEKLREWCKNAYKKGFKEESDNMNKLVKKFCLKS